MPPVARTCPAHRRQQKIVQMPVGDTVTRADQRQMMVLGKSLTSTMVSDTQISEQEYKPQDAQVLARTLLQAVRSV
jgi:hypothetical protein